MVSLWLYLYCGRHLFAAMAHGTKFFKISACSVTVGDSATVASLLKSFHWLLFSVLFLFSLCPASLSSTVSCVLAQLSIHSSILFTSCCFGFVCYEIIIISKVFASCRSFWWCVGPSPPPLSTGRCVAVGLFSRSLPLCAVVGLWQALCPNSPCICQLPVRYGIAFPDFNPLHCCLLPVLSSFHLVAPESEKTAVV